MVDAVSKPLSTIRAAWKVYWRLRRICLRETRAAELDMLLYGVGFVKVGPDVPDLVMRVDPRSVVVEIVDE